MRKVFLDNLPKRGKLIDWKNSIGYKVNFIYDNIEGAFKILGYIPNLNRLIFEYNGKSDYEIYTGHLREAKISFILGCKNRDFLYDVGTVLRDDDKNITITDSKIRKVKQKKYKMYQYNCNICGFNCKDYYRNGNHFEEMWVYEGNLKKGRGCPVCASNSKAVKLGVNTIWDTDRWMVDLGISEKDSKKYSKCSVNYINACCPHCKRNKEVKIVDIYTNKSIACTCGDGVSYPEKFLYELLNQLNIRYIHQASSSNFDWCGGYKYDFYLPDSNCIIETHGMQHYKNVATWNVNIEKIKNNDKSKKEKAEGNGIAEYIVLDCRFSNLEHIRNSILNSQLNNTFDLCNIDWLKCEEFAMSNLLKEVCYEWKCKDDAVNVDDLAQKFNLSNTTIRDYLSKGTKYGFCIYSPEEETRKGIAKSHISQSRQIEVFKGDVSIGIFETVRCLFTHSEEWLGVELTQSGISLACRKDSLYKGFRFKYITKNK